jgi:hypothetical protein
VGLAPTGKRRLCTAHATSGLMRRYPLSARRLPQGRRKCDGGWRIMMHTGRSGAPRSIRTVMRSLSRQTRSASSAISRSPGRIRRRTFRSPWANCRRCVQGHQRSDATANRISTKSIWYSDRTFQTDERWNCFSTARCCGRIAYLDLTAHAAARLTAMIIEGLTSLISARGAR